MEISSAVGTSLDIPDILLVSTFIFGYGVTAGRTLGLADEVCERCVKNGSIEGLNDAIPMRGKHPKNVPKSLHAMLATSSEWEDNKNSWLEVLHEPNCLLGFPVREFRQRVQLGSFVGVFRLGVPLGGSARGSVRKGVLG